MRSRRRGPNLNIPASLMVWSIHDPVIEDPIVLERQFDDIRKAGFGGVAVFVRCSRYTWFDEPARRAMKRISDLCRLHDMHCWIGPDPRFLSRPLIAGSGGVRLLLFGDRSRASRVPHCAPIIGGRFNIRCELPPRHTHMVHEVALEFTPEAIAKVYAVKAGTSALGRGEWHDITSKARLFYNARDRYVEAFGSYIPPDDEEWEVLAFFQVRASQADYSNLSQMATYLSALDRLAHEGIETQSVMWDEPGFTCTYGSLPCTPKIERLYSRATRRELRQDLWKLAIDADDGSQVPVRVSYFRCVQKVVNQAHKKTTAHARRLFGKDTFGSIHDTWHFESADMCDMNHGSLDLWEAGKTKQGGFVDIGGVNQLRDPDSPHYANLAAMAVVCSSLGKLRPGKYCYNNLWTVGDDKGEGWQTSVMDHCVNVLAAFGNRWLAHAYGPVGTIGEENTFLGSPPLPGYPHHSTWTSFPEWNRRLREHFATVGCRLPWSNVLIVYPVETFYGHGDSRADGAAEAIFLLVRDLLDSHYHVDVLAPSAMEDARWRGQRLRVKGVQYEAVVCPFPDTLDSRMVSLVRRSGGRLLCAFTRPARTTENKPVKFGGVPFANDAGGVLNWLETMHVPRPVGAPAGTWVTMTEMHDHHRICVVPSRHGGSYSGSVSYGGQTTDIPESRGLRVVTFEQQDRVRC